jgi:hypothetical protein
MMMTACVERSARSHSGLISVARGYTAHHQHSSLHVVGSHSSASAVPLGQADLVRTLGPGFEDWWEEAYCCSVTLGMTRRTWKRCLTTRKAVAEVKVIRLGHFERAQVVLGWVSTVASPPVLLAGGYRHSLQVRVGYQPRAAE